jgi:hypothetical protein
MAEGISETTLEASPVAPNVIEKTPSMKVALAVVVFNGLLYLTHHLLGDPVVPGWITPAIPLVMAYCSASEGWPPGPRRTSGDPGRSPATRSGSARTAGGSGSDDINEAMDQLADGRAVRQIIEY